ncbi:MAG: hypothetical protein FWC38_00595 [Proteobacteria bacterium]|nr:hypothetical protein [Pseudomonadota bacterium]MCL2306740.1 hypothetical protein [Pseudomonadota bacterium]
MSGQTTSKVTRPPLPNGGGSYIVKDGALVQTQAPTKPAVIRRVDKAAGRHPPTGANHRPSPASGRGEKTQDQTAAKE